MQQFVEFLTQQLESRHTTQIDQIFRWLTTTVHVLPVNSLVVNLHVTQVVALNLLSLEKKEQEKVTITALRDMSCSSGKWKSRTMQHHMSILLTCVVSKPQGRPMAFIIASSFGSGTLRKQSELERSRNKGPKRSSHNTAGAAFPPSLSSLSAAGS